MLEVGDRVEDKKGIFGLGIVVKVAIDGDTADVIFEDGSVPRQQTSDLRVIKSNPVVNPFELRTKNNPKKRIVAEYDPSEAQFQAEVQGIYESLIRKHLGLRYNTAFRDPQGVRIDIKYFVPATELREILSNAYAIATRQGQKHGRLQPGTQKATAKGKAKAKSRAKDKAHLAKNVQDYEETLQLVRKGESFRIVKRGQKFYVSPHQDGLRKSGYKTKASAKAALTRFENTRLNPSSSREIQAARRAEIAQASSMRKPSRARAYYNEWTAKVQIAALRNRLEGRGQPGKPPLLTPEKIRLRPRKGSDDLSLIPIAVQVVQKYVYLPQMKSKGIPYLMYRKAPIASYYTIEMIGPSRKFTAPVDGAFSSIYSTRRWRPSDWAGFKGQDFKIKQLKAIIDEKTGKVKSFNTRKGIGYTAITFYPGSKFRSSNGYRSEAVYMARDAVIEEYPKWYKKHKKELSKKDPTLRFPEDCLQPLYGFIQCDDRDYNVIDPIVHFGVFLRALADTLLMMESVAAAKSNEIFNTFDASQLVKWIEDNNLQRPVYRAMTAVGLEKQIELILPRFKPLAEVDPILKEQMAEFNAEWSEYRKSLKDFQGSPLQSKLGARYTEASNKARDLYMAYNEADEEDKEELESQIEQTIMIDLESAQQEMFGAYEELETAPVVVKEEETESDDVMNVWFGTNENSWLSNLALRPFTYDGRDYFSVEQAYQTLKSGSFDNNTYSKKKWKRAGTKIAGKKAKTKANYNIKLMKKLMFESFAQNPDVAQQLVALGDVTFTHTQDSGIWKNKFPELLKQVQQKLATTPQKANPRRRRK